MRSRKAWRAALQLLAAVLGLCQPLRESEAQLQTSRSLTVSAAALGTGLTAPPAGLGASIPNPAAIAANVALSLAYYEQSDVGLSGTELGVSVPVGRFSVAGVLQYLALDDVISPELAGESPELAGLGVDMAYAALAAAWRVSGSLSLGAALGRRWEDILGVQRSEWHGMLGVLVELPGRLRFGAALLDLGPGDVSRAAGTAVSFALSRSTDLAGVTLETSIGAEYTGRDRTLSGGAIGLYVRPPGPLFALVGLGYARQPFQEGAPYYRSIVLGLGVSVGSIRSELARRWRQEGLGSELFVTLGLRPQ